MKNKHGLSRDIPSDIKRTIRQRCGFGCVICGLGIFHYEHVSPKFSQAKQHDPDCMTLLCPQCHEKVTRGFWSKNKVLAAMKTPKCKELGYTREVFDIGSGHPILKIGGATLTNCPIPIQIQSIPLFEIKPAEEEGAPFRLSGFFCDSEGKPTLQIEDNEWKAGSGNWDVEIKGASLIIRESKGNIHLKLLAKPPDTLIIERLSMFFRGYSIQANEADITINNPHGGSLTLSNCFMDNSTVGMSL